MATIRAPAVAGSFYPNDAHARRAMLATLLATQHSDAPPPKAIIAPHAGYIYSGPIAASVYARLEPLRGAVKRVVLAGPAHRVWVDGIALPSVAAFDSPLGAVRLDTAAIEQLRRLPFAETSDRAHAMEHSLEVH